MPDCCTSGGSTSHLHVGVISGNQVQDMTASLIYGCISTYVIIFYRIVITITIYLIFSIISFITEQDGYFYIVKAENKMNESWFYILRIYQTDNNLMEY